MAMPRPKTIPASAFLLPPSPKGEHQPAHHDGNQAESSRNGSGERLLQHVYGLQPRARPLRHEFSRRESKDAHQKNAALRDG